MSLKVWANRRQPVDLTLDLVLAIVLFGLAMPVLSSLGSGGLTIRPVSPSPNQTSSHVKALRQAIVGQESNGDCSIQNHSGSGAAGLAQIMPENIPVWSQEALGRTVTLQEFLSDCQLQLQIVDFKLNQYWHQEFQQSEGDPALAVRRTASRWYSGQGAQYDSSSLQFWNGARYPSIRDYTLSVLDRYNATVSHSKQ
ncbi:lytic transglycosylase domain-containing protein [Phormidesmis sp. 146-12]